MVLGAEKGFRVSGWVQGLAKVSGLKRLEGFYGFFGLRGVMLSGICALWLSLMA